VTQKTSTDFTDYTDSKDIKRSAVEDTFADQARPNTRFISSVFPLSAYPFAEVRNGEGQIPGSTVGHP
jgi:hypothetical protein